MAETGQFKQVGIRIGSELVRKIEDLRENIKSSNEWQMVRCSHDPSQSDVIRFAIEFLHRERCQK